MGDGKDLPGANVCQRFLYVSPDRLGLTISSDLRRGKTEGVEELLNRLL